MNEADLLAVALKHKLPMVPQTPDSHPWAYTDQVMAFGRDLAGEEWPAEHAFPPMPNPVHIHSKLGGLFARFDMQMYAVQFQKRSLAAISEELGLHGEDAGNPELILQAIKDMRIHADHCALDSWWIKSLMEFWGNGAQDMDTRRAAKVACNLAAQVFAKGDLLADAFDIVNKKIEGEQAAAATFEDWVKSEFCITVEQAKRASFGVDALRKAFELGRDSAKPAVQCAARKQGTAGGNAPAECDWPGCGCDEAAGKVIEALADENNVALTFAQRDVLRERQHGHHVREGFTDKRDDEYKPGTLANAAAAYALAAGDELNPTRRGAAGFFTQPSRVWPFSMTWWKPKNPRNALVKAAALLLAEIEKIDRNACKSKEAANG